MKTLNDADFGNTSLWVLLSFRSRKLNACDEVTPQSSAAALGIPPDDLRSSKGGFFEGFSLQNGKVLVLLEEIFDFQKRI